MELLASDYRAKTDVGLFRFPLSATTILGARSAISAVSVRDPFLVLGHLLLSSVTWRASARLAHCRLIMAGEEISQRSARPVRE